MAGVSLFFKVAGTLLKVGGRASSAICYREAWLAGVVGVVDAGNILIRTRPRPSNTFLALE